MTDRVTYLGHATVLLEVANRRILTDPLLTGGVGFIRRHSGAAPGLSSQPDVVIVSHGHHDHLHRASLRLISAEVPIVAPRGLGALIRSWGVASVKELGVDEATTVGSVTITAVKADHSGYRPPSGPRGQAIGFVVAGAERTIYFAGDTDLFPEMADIGRDGLDVALLPVWGWGPRLGPGHLDPERAAKAVALLQPRVAIPIHWGTLWPFAMPWRRHLTEPPMRLARAVAELALDTRVVVLAPGESYQLPTARGGPA